MYTLQTFVKHDTDTVIVILRTKNGKAMPIGISRKFTDTYWRVNVTLKPPKYAGTVQPFHYHELLSNEEFSIKNIINVLSTANKKMQSTYIKEWKLWQKEVENKKIGYFLMYN